MHLLFIKQRLAWPRSSGHDVHCYFLMQALQRLGHEVSLLCADRPAPEAVEGLPLSSCATFAEEADQQPLALTALQERFRRYWGIEPAALRAASRAAHEADVVVAAGLDVLPCLAGVEGAMRVWYAADEYAWHHLSQLRPWRPSTWQHLKAGIVNGLYERAFRAVVDRTWVVSETERRAMTWLGGMAQVDVVPNGVDGAQYRPVRGEQLPHSCTFWGRLDAGPNLQALEWFCGRVWPRVRREVPDARFTVCGFHPPASLRALDGRDGISIRADVTDLCGEVGRHQVAVLPFVSGGGIKNKLLEAAALAMPILATRRACGGLLGGPELPLVRADRASDWVRALIGLWADESRRRSLGDAARRWVETWHTWEGAARLAVAGLEGFSEPLAASRGQSRKRLAANGGSCA